MVRAAAIDETPSCKCQHHRDAKPVPTRKSKANSASLTTPRVTLPGAPAAIDETPSLVDDCRVEDCRETDVGRQMSDVRAGASTCEGQHHRDAKPVPTRKSEANSVTRSSPGLTLSVLRAAAFDETPLYCGGLS